jgi:hypothetical protein
MGYYATASGINKIQQRQVAVEKGPGLSTCNSGDFLLQPASGISIPVVHVLPVVQGGG